MLLHGDMGRINKEASNYIKRINFSPNMVSIGDDAYGLDRWYDVPRSISMDDFKDNVIQGLIKADRTRDNWDLLRLSGGLSGYFSDVSALVTGESSSFVSTVMLAEP